MAHRVKIAPGVHQIALPDGEIYDAGDEVVLTDAQFAALAPSVLGDEVLDLGEEPEEGDGGGGSASPWVWNAQVNGWAAYAGPVASGFQVTPSDFGGVIDYITSNGEMDIQVWADQKDLATTNFNDTGQLLRVAWWPGHPLPSGSIAQDGHLYVTIAGPNYDQTDPEPNATTLALIVAGATAGGNGLPSLDLAMEDNVPLVCRFITMQAAMQQIAFDEQSGFYPDGGTYTLTIEGQTTEPLAVDTSVEDVAAAIVAAWPPGNAPQAYSDEDNTETLATGRMVFTWGGLAMGADPAPMTIDTSNLTGVSAPYTPEMFIVTAEPWVDGTGREVRWGDFDYTSFGGGGGLDIPGPPQDQQGILIGADVGGNQTVMWYPAERGQMWVGHESAGWVWLNPGDPGQVLKMGDEGDPEWGSPPSGVMADDNRWYYYIDPTDYGAITSGDSVPQDWTYYDGISYPGSEDPNGRSPDGWVQIAAAGWYAFHGSTAVFFNGAGVMDFALRVGGMMFGRDRKWKPAGMDGIANDMTASAFAVVYCAEETMVYTDTNVQTAAGTWGIADARLIIHRLA